MAAPQPSLRGLAFDFEPAYGPPPPRDTHIIGLHVQKTTPDMKLVRDAVAAGARKHPDAIWVVFDTDKVAQEILAEYDIVPLRLSLNPYWKGDGYDLRRPAREYELLQGCTEVVVFQREGASTSWMERAKQKLEYGIHANLFVIACGKPKAQRRVQRRAPVGA